MRTATSSGSCRTPNGARKRSSGVRMGIGSWPIWPKCATARLLPYIDRYGPLREAVAATKPFPDLARGRRVPGGLLHRPQDRRNLQRPRHRAASAPARAGERVLRLPGLLPERAFEGARDLGARRRDPEPGVTAAALAGDPYLGSVVPARPEAARRVRGARRDGVPRVQEVRRGPVESPRRAHARRSLRDRCALRARASGAPP